MNVNKYRLPNLGIKIILIYLVAILVGNVIIGYFVPSASADSPPSGVILYIPTDNSYLNDVTPTLTWYPSFDADGDPLRYDVEVYDSLNITVAYSLTGFFVTTWDVTPALQDGQTYHWRVRANDTQFQINSTGPWSSYWFFTVDITSPSISSGSADFTTYTGKNFNIYANFSDNTGVTFSTLYYKKSAATSYKSQAMLESAQNQFYISNEFLAINTTNDDDDYFYFIIVEDRAANNVNYSKSGSSDFQITVLDNIPPFVQYGSANFTTTTDDEFSIQISGIDNIGIANVNLFIRKIGGPWQTVELNKYYQNYHIINYTDLKPQIGFNTSNGIDCEYYILVYDPSTNVFNYSNPLGAPWEIEVLDNDAPSIVQGSGNLEITTDDPFTIYANFTDNVGVTRAVLYIRENTGPASNWYNINMLEVSGNNFATNYDDLKAHTGLQMDTASGGNYEYFVVAYDTANNIYNYSQDLDQPWDIIVIDNDPPSFISCSGNFEVATGDPFVISAEFTDNIAVTNLKIFLYSVLDESWVYTWMNRDATGGLGKFSITSASLKAELGIDTTYDSIINYYLVASDPINNECRYPENGTEFLEITVVDNGLPIFVDGTDDLTVYTADNFTIYAEFYDNLGINSATLFYRTISPVDPQNGEWSEFNMILTESLLGIGYFRFAATNVELNIDTSYNSLDYNYYIIAYDGDANSVNYGSSSNPHKITVIDSVSPVLETLLTYPETLAADYEDDFIVHVTVSDLGGSGFDAQSVALRYKRGSYDAIFSEYVSMEIVTSNVVPNEKIITEWQFAIPRPHQQIPDNDKIDGWELVLGEYISFEIKCADIEGNIVESGIHTEYVGSVSLNHAPSVYLLAPNGNENFMNYQYIFWIADDIDNDELVITIELSDDNGINWQFLATDLENNGSYKLDTTLLDNGNEYLIKIIASDGVLTGTNISDSVFTIYNTVKLDDNLKTSSGDSDDIIPLIIAGIIIAVIVASAGFIGGTEVGKYKFFSLILAPLYSKLNRDEVLDHFVRGQIYGYIKANPGEHYNAIKESLELNNGTLSHHLKILEKQEYIYSKRDKFYTRFYPKGMKISVADAAQLNKIQKIIVNKVRETPGLTQHEIITLLGASQQVVSYNLTKLTRENVLRIAKQGREKRYYINHVDDAPVSEVKAASPAQPAVVQAAPPQQVEVQPPVATPVKASSTTHPDNSPAESTINDESQTET